MDEYYSRYYTRDRRSLSARARPHDAVDIVVLDVPEALAEHVAQVAQAQQVPAEKLVFLRSATKRGFSTPAEKPSPLDARRGNAHPRNVGFSTPAENRHLSTPAEEHDTANARLDLHERVLLLVVDQLHLARL